MARRIVNKNFAVALAAGTVVGAGVALLFAPQSGRRTRRDIRLFAERVGNKAEAAKLQMQHSVFNTIGDAEDKIVSVMKSGKEWTDSKMTEVRHALDAVRKCVARENGKARAA